MPLEGNRLDAARRKERQVGDLRQIVRVDEHFELRAILEAVFMQVSRRDRIVAGERLHQRRRQRQFLIRLGDVHKLRAVEPCHVLAGRAAVLLKARADGLRASGFAVVAHESEKRLHGRALAVARGRAVENEQAFVARVSGEGVAEGFLQILGLFYCRRFIRAAHDFLHESLPARATGVRVVGNAADLRKKVLGTVFSEFAGSQIQRSVLAIQQVGIAVKIRRAQAVYAGRILENRLPHASIVPAGGALEAHVPQRGVRDFRGQ